MLSPWQKYNQSHKNSPPRPRLLKTLDQFARTSGLALDIGAGAGRDSLELLRRGWQVTAVESDLASATALEEMAKDFSDSLKVLAVKMEDLSPLNGKFNLVNASYSLPFCAPSEFEKMWAQLFEMLEFGGLFTAEIFGERDGWNKMGTDMSFHARLQAERLLGSYEILDFEEIEEEKSTFSGPNKALALFQRDCSKTKLKRVKIKASRSSRRFKLRKYLNIEKIQIFKIKDRGFPAFLTHVRYQKAPGTLRYSRAGRSAGSPALAFLWSLSALEP